MNHFIKESASMDSLSSTTRAPKSRIARLLPVDYKLGENDVYVGRRNLYRLHPGNIRFNDIVHSNLERYYYCTNRRDKTSIIYDVIDQVRAGCTEGGFVKRSKTTGRWYDVGDAGARDKTSQAFRDATIGIYKSSRSGKTVVEESGTTNAEETLDSFENKNYKVASLQPNFDAGISCWQQPVNQEVNWYQDRISSRNQCSGSSFEFADSKPPGYSHSDKNTGDSAINFDDDDKLCPSRNIATEYSNENSFDSESSTYTSITSAIENDNIALEEYSVIEKIAFTENASSLHHNDENEIIDLTSLHYHTFSNPPTAVMYSVEAPTPSTAAIRDTSQTIETASDQEKFDLLLQLYEKLN